VVVGSGEIVYNGQIMAGMRQDPSAFVRVECGRIGPQFNAILVHQGLLPPPLSR